MLLQFKIALFCILFIIGTTAQENSTVKENSTTTNTSLETTTITISTTTTIKPNNNTNNQTQNKDELKQSQTNSDRAAQYELYPIQFLSPQFDRSFPRIQPQILFYGNGGQGQQPILINPGNPPGNFLIPHGGGGPNVILRNNPQTPLFPSAGYPRPAHIPPIEKDAEEIPTNPAKIPPFGEKPSIHHKPKSKPEKLETFDNESPNHHHAGGDDDHITRNGGDNPEVVSLRPDQRFFFLNGKNLFDYPKETAASWPYSNHNQPGLKYADIDSFSKSKLKDTSNNGNHFNYPNDAGSSWLSSNGNDQSDFDYGTIGKIEDNHGNDHLSPIDGDGNDFNYAQREIWPFLSQNNVPNVKYTKVQPFPQNPPKFLQPFQEPSQVLLKTDENHAPRSEINPASNFILYNPPLIVTHAEHRPHLLSPIEHNGVVRTAQSYERKPFASEPPSFHSFRQSKSDFVQPHVIGQFRFIPNQPVNNQYTQEDIENDAVIVDADDLPEATILERTEAKRENITTENNNNSNDNISVNFAAKSNETESLNNKEPAEPSTAQAGPQATAIAGPGGVAGAAPKATAIVGKGGVAVSSPQATAVAGTKNDEKKKKPTKKTDDNK